MRVLSLASGSSGNALVIDTGQTRLLVDAGISARRIGQGLAQHGLSIRMLDAVLITHEHSDHVRGIETLGRRFGLRFYLTPGTARALPLMSAFSHQLIGRAATFDIGDATITSLPVRHDAAETCGFVIEAGDTTVAVFTDLGCGEPHLHDPLRRADLIVLEANHDLKRLWAGYYPWSLKRRVASDTGHLCNDDAGALLADAIADDRPRAVWLAHLSADNNEPELARAAVAAATDGRALDLHVLPRHTSGPMWRDQPIS